MSETHDEASTRWQEWMTRWDRQQQAYIEDRERCFEVLLSFVDTLVPAELRALDLACGPGSVSDRLLRRFPGARCTALDADPVLLELGRRALGELDGRLTWLQADLRDPSWAAELGSGELDLVVSSTATHWLAPAQLAALYGELARLLRPGGVLLNADRLEFDRGLTGVRAATTALDDRRQARASAGGAESWDHWWKELAQEPGMQAAFAERERCFPRQDIPTDHNVATLEFHVSALREAGFSETAVVWQDLDHRLLLALR